MTDLGSQHEIGAGFPPSGGDVEIALPAMEQCVREGANEVPGQARDDVGDEPTPVTGVLVHPSPESSSTPSPECSSTPSSRRKPGSPTPADARPPRSRIKPGTTSRTSPPSPWPHPSSRRTPGSPTPADARPPRSRVKPGTTSRMSPRPRDPTRHPGESRDLQHQPTPGHEVRWSLRQPARTRQPRRSTRSAALRSDAAAHSLPRSTAELSREPWRPPIRPARREPAPRRVRRRPRSARVRHPGGTSGGSWPGDSTCWSRPAPSRRGCARP